MSYISRIHGLEIPKLIETSKGLFYLRILHCALFTSTLSLRGDKDQKTEGNHFHVFEDRRESFKKELQRKIFNLSQTEYFFSS